MSNSSTTPSKVSSKVFPSELFKSIAEEQPNLIRAEQPFPTIPGTKDSATVEITLAESTEKNSRITMKVLLLTILVSLIGWVLATEISTPFLNSTGKTVNNVPYWTREYWMKQAVEELFKFQGPWYFHPPPCRPFPMFPFPPARFPHSAPFSHGVPGFPQLLSP